MVDDDSDYELIPRKEIEKLKNEIILLKKNPYGESDKGKDLQQSIDKLNNTINRLITILEDAQQDIIDEYQESKPIEKLNQILDQNETIAKVLISINDKLSGKKNEDSAKEKIDTQESILMRSSQIPVSQPNLSQSQFNQFPKQQFTSQTIPQLNQQSQFNQFQFSSQKLDQQLSEQQNQFYQKQYTPYLQSSQSSIQSMPNQKTSLQTQNIAPLSSIDDLNSNVNNVNLSVPLDSLDTKKADILPEKRKKFLGFI